MIVVSDTSPISNLILIGRLTLLKDIYHKIIIPPSVHTEVLALAHLEEDISEYLHADWIEIKTPTNLSLIENLLKDLDEGEAEAIVWLKNCTPNYC